MDLDYTIKRIKESTVQKTFYHFTSLTNIPSIRIRGLRSYALLKEGGINFAHGGNDLSLTLDRQMGMDQYVHLSFRETHPMKHRLQQEGKSSGMTSLQISPDVLKIPGVLITDEVSNSADVARLSFPDAIKIIDFEILYDRSDWKDPAIQKRLSAAERCEILVPNIISVSFIRV